MAKRGSLANDKEKELEERPIRFRRYKYLFLIVCEDENTEPEYFKKFQNKIPKETIFLKSVGTGRDPKGVIERAIEEREKLSQEAKKEVDVVWAVFDKDDAHENPTKVKRFTEAFEIAQNSKINTAYSNEVFELWFLLHLTEVDSANPLPRKEIYNLLQQLIVEVEKYSVFVYEHGNANIVEIIEEIGNENNAISRAEMLLQNQKGKKPIEANPSTKVHLLVRELKDWIAYFSLKPVKLKKIFSFLGYFFSVV